jgi:ribosomal protein L7/L12
MTQAPLPPKAHAALKAGNKIEAIKQLRMATGIGLKEAKDWIDAFERGGSPAPAQSANAPFTLPPAAIDALKRGNPIEAIKIVRQATGAGLAEAKSLIDEIHRQLPKHSGTLQLPPELRHREGLSPGEVPRTPSAGKWILMAVIAFGAILAVVVFR